MVSGDLLQFSDLSSNVFNLLIFVDQIGLHSLNSWFQVVHRALDSVSFEFLELELAHNSSVFKLFNLLLGAQGSFYLNS